MKVDTSSPPTEVQAESRLSMILLSLVFILWFLHSVSWLMSEGGYITPGLISEVIRGSFACMQQPST
jgi:bacteriorhodopsin